MSPSWLHLSMTEHHLLSHSEQKDSVAIVHAGQWADEAVELRDCFADFPHSVLRLL
jgi:hypothetical protein